MHDPRVRRFFAVDPLAHQYPHNSPYAFSENRVIDGIELEGSEYKTYILDFFEGSAEPIIRVQNFNDNQLNSYGSDGRGVKYLINHYHNGKNTFAQTFFIERGNILNYGLYYGSKSLYSFKKSGFTKEYDYFLDPIDAVDSGAYYHDKAYDKLDAKGASGLLDDFATTPADVAAVKIWEKVIELGEGGIDPKVGEFSNGQKITKDEVKAAKKGVFGFKKFIGAKKAKIHLFMSYKNAPYSGWLQKDFSKEAIDKSYENFTKEYLFLDKDLQYRRVKGKWENVGTDEEPIWKPIPKKNKEKE